MDRVRANNKLNLLMQNEAIQQICNHASGKPCQAITKLKSDMFQRDSRYTDREITTMSKTR